MKGEWKMDHSVRAYLERLPIQKLNAFLDDEAFALNNTLNDTILQDLLEVLIARSNEPGSDLSRHIPRIEKLRSQR